MLVRNGRARAATLPGRGGIGPVPTPAGAVITLQTYIGSISAELQIRLVLRGGDSPRVKTRLQKFERSLGIQPRKPGNPW